MKHVSLSTTLVVAGITLFIACNGDGPPVIPPDDTALDDTDEVDDTDDTDVVVDTDDTDDTDVPDVDPLPGRVLQEGAGTRALDFNGATWLNGGLIAVGSNPGSDRDGLLLRADSGTTAMLVGGSGNDQLFAVVGRGDTFIGVGITRSFRGNDQGNHGLLALGGVQGDVTLRRHRITGDQAVEPRAVAVHDEGWAVAGRHLDGSRFYVSVLDEDGDVVRARSVQLPGSGQRVHTPRGVISLGDRLLVVGDVLAGAVVYGFLVDFDADDLAVRGAYTVAGATMAALDDVARHQGELVAVGSVDDGGFALRIDASTGAVVSATRYGGVSIASVAAHGGRLHVVADEGNGLVVGELDGASLAGARHSELRRPAFFGRVPLRADAGGIAVVGRVAGTQTLREQPLNPAHFGLCADVRVGEAVTWAPLASAATVSAVTVDEAALLIATDTLTGASVTSLSASQVECQ